MAISRNSNLKLYLGKFLILDGNREKLNLCANYLYYIEVLDIIAITYLY